MATTVQNKRGLRANQPTSGMLAGELFLHTDRGTAKFALDATTSIDIVPAIDALGTLATVDGASDFILLHDADGSGVKEKKMTFNAFKAALAIPAGSTDEKAAVASGGTPGFIWGSNGADGIIRLHSSLSWVKDSGSAFVTIKVETVDCGTF